VACRQLSDFEAAYEHTEAALELHNDSLIAHYEHAVNAVCLSQSQVDSRRTDALKREALAELRQVLWKDERYAARVDTEPYFEPVRGECSGLLEELRLYLEKEADHCLERIDGSIRTFALSDKSPSLLFDVAPKVLEAHQLVYTLRKRASICDLLELRNRAPELSANIQAGCGSGQPAERDFQINRLML